MTGSRRTCASLILLATSSTLSLSRAQTMPLVMMSRTGVSGPCPLATPRTAMSRSVIMPISRSPSVTGIEPASALSMKVAASRAVWSGRTVATSRVITSLILIVRLLAGDSGLETNGMRATFLLLRNVLGQQVVGGDKLVFLVEDLDRPSNDAGVLAFQRLRADRELD